MRRSQKEITDSGEIEDILHGAAVCRIGLCDGGLPYIVPVNFAYRDNAIYLHSAREGRKLDIIRTNSQVCVEVDIDTELVRGERACDWGMRFRSVIGDGTATIVDDPDAKKRALSIIMEKYSGSAAHDFDARSLAQTAVIRVDLHHVTGKRSG